MPWPQLYKAAPRHHETCVQLRAQMVLLQCQAWRDCDQGRHHLVSLPGCAAGHTAQLCGSIKIDRVAGHSLLRCPDKRPSSEADSPLSVYQGCRLPV